MTDEVDRVSTLHSRREEELQAANRSLRLEAAGLRQMIGGMTEGKDRREAETRAQIQENVERYQRIINDLTEELKEEKVETQKVLGLYNTALGELKAERDRGQSLQKELAGQKVQTLGATESAAKTARTASQAEIAQQLLLAQSLARSAEAERLSLRDESGKAELESRCETLRQEKQTLETQLNDTAKISQENLRARDAEIDQLRGYVDALLGEGGRREWTLNEHCKEVSQEVARMQEEFETSGVEMVRQTEQLSGVKKEVEKMVESLYVSLSERETRSEGTDFKSLYEAQTKELDVLQEQLAVKDKELTAIKDSKLLNINATRKSVTAALGELLEYLGDAPKREDEMAKLLEGVRASVEKLPMPAAGAEDSAGRFRAEVQRLAAENARLKNELLASTEGQARDVKP